MTELNNTTPLSGSVPNSSDSNQQEIDRLKRELADLQRKYNGLDGTMTEALRVEREAKISFERLFGDASGKLVSYQQSTETKISELERMANEKTTALEQREAELNQLKSETELLKTVTEQFPSLAPLYKAGAINTSGLSGDSLTNYLKALNDTVSQTSAQLAKESLSGSTPPRPNQPIPNANKPGDGSKRTVKEIRKEMATVKPGSPEYVALFNEFYDSLE